MDRTKSFFYIMSFLLTVTGCAFSQRKSRKMLQKAKEKKYDVIIVPGLPYENGAWNQLMQGRVYWAKYLYDTGVAKKIMFSGGAVYSPHYECKIMGLYAEALGVPKEDILIEKMAEHSSENAYYGYHKGKNLGYSKIAIASDPFQTKMLKPVIRKKIGKENIDLIPFVFDTLSQHHTEDANSVKINDSSAFEPNFQSIKERESFFKRVAGTMGKNINESYYSEGKTQDD